MRLRSRLAVAVGAVGLVSLAGVSVAAWALSADEVRDSVDDELRQRLAPILAADERIASGELALPAGGSIEAGEVGRSTSPLGRVGPFVVGGSADEPSVLEVGAPAEFRFLFDRGDAVTVGGEGGPDGLGEQAPPTSAAIASLDDEATHFETIDAGGNSYRIATAPLELGPAVVEAGIVDGEPPVGIQVIRDVGNEEAGLSDLAVRLGVLSALGVSLVAVASWLIGRRMAKPVDDLTERAEHLAELDDLPSRVETSRTDEFGRLADSFNRMLAALEIGREQQQRLVADASHELRTPLTSLRMRLEYLAKHAGVERREVLDGAVADAEHLSALVHDLVDLAADVRSAEEEPEPRQLAELLSEVADQVQLSTQRDVSVVADETVAEIRPTMVHRAVRNLLDNAVKYAPDGPIEIRAVDGRISVHDAGPGVPSDEQELIFDRFYRSPQARNRVGNGIGLAIVQQVADAHRGTTWVGASPLGGAEIGFSVATLQEPFRSRSGRSHAHLGT